jgi:hypothetical protein
MDGLGEMRNYAMGLATDPMAIEFENNARSIVPVRAGAIR